jgi:hypothetical protein
MAADHRAMVKFASRDDPGYKRVASFLSRWIGILKEAENNKPQQVIIFFLLGSL